MRHAFLSGAVALLLPAVVFAGPLRIAVLDIGQGDATVVIAPSGCAALLDAGPTGSGTTIKAYLKAQGITRLDFAVLSHYHEDHLGAIDEVEKGTDPVTVGQVYDHGGTYSSVSYNSYATQYTGRRVTATVGQTFKLCNEVSFTVVASDANGVSSNDENAHSVAVKLSYGPLDMLIGGDLTATPDIESGVAPRVGPIEVYKVHHHGSATSSNAALIAGMAPQVSLISCGYNNTYGHPAASTVSRLTDAGSEIWQTEDPATQSKRGTIELTTTDGRTYTVLQGTSSRSYVSKGVDVVPPTAPASLTAVARNGNEIDLAWTAGTDNVAVGGYLVEWSSDSRQFQQLAMTTVTTYADTDLVEGTTFWYRVRTVDGQGNISPPSPVAFAATGDTTAPTVPGGLTAKAYGLTAVNLAWSAAFDDVGVTGYRLVRDGVVRATLPALTFRDTGLVADESHRYQVAAFDAAGNVSMASPEIVGQAACRVSIVSLSYASRYLTVKASSTRANASLLTAAVGTTSTPMTWTPTQKVWTLRKYFGTRPTCAVITGACGGKSTKCF